MKRILQPHGYLHGRMARKDVRDNLTIEGVDTKVQWITGVMNGQGWARCPNSPSSRPSSWPPRGYPLLLTSPLQQPCSVPCSPKLFFMVTSAENLFSDHLLWLFLNGRNSHVYGRPISTEYLLTEEHDGMNEFLSTIMMFVQSTL